MPEESYVFPMSFAQQRLWFLDRIEPGNPFYNIPLAIPVRANLDVRALRHALTALVDRHESLRTTFRVIDGEPCQVVHPPAELDVSVMDLRHLPPGELGARTLELATEEARKPFDLEQGPLLRCSLIKRGMFDYVLLLTMHHIISDGWSMGIVANELTALYQSFSMGIRGSLPELPIQYADFAVWQRQWLQGETLQEQLGYWRGRLSDPPVLEMPADRPRPPVLTYRGASHPVRLSPALSAEVRRFARTRDCTPFMVLLGAFSALLHLYTGQDDIVIGTPVANRNRGEIEGLIGFFVNSLVLRVDLAGDPSFKDLLARIREVTLGAYAHQDLPFEKLVEELQPPRDPSRNPLFQVTFQLVNTPTLQGVAAGAESSVIQVQRGSAIFDIAFTLMDNPACFSGIFEYSTDLFDPETIARIERHFRWLLEGALANPDSNISRLPVMSAAEESGLIELSHGPRNGPPVQPFVHRAIREQAERTPSALAVQAEDGELSYRELMSRTHRLAAYLRARGVDWETRVGILMDRSAGMVTAMLAVLEAGGVYVPLDPTYPAERLRFMVQDSRAKVVLTHARHEYLAGSLAGADTAMVSLDADSRAILSCADLPCPVDLMPENLAYILYTSGSTGRPKGVAIPHRALANHMAWMQGEFPLDEADRVLQRTPYSFDASVWEFFAPLMAGAVLVVLPPDAQRNPELIVKSMVDHGITVVQFVPSLLGMVLDEPGFYTCTALRRIFCGGEVLSEDLAEIVKRSVDVELVNLYGPTEATIDSTFFRCTEARQPFGVPIGDPIANAQTFVLDGNLGQVPLGVAGELYLAGAALARGYIDQPGMTADRFLPDPYSGTPGSRMYRTGDRVRRLSDGSLLFLGRVDGQVKLRGYRIELGEIEAAIRRVSGVQSCAVATETSDGDIPGMVAYVVPGEAALPRSDSLVTEAEEEHISCSEGMFEQLYGGLPSAPDPSSSFVGWNSSYTGLPIGTDEMAEWLASTVGRIRMVNPRRVLEIGCGTGLLLRQIARDCERYVGTDFSRPVLRYLEAQLGSLDGGGRNVQLLRRDADDLEGIPERSFDTVILNSVVQYFPDIDYLVRTLQATARAVTPGGSIFVGDVRSLPLLETFQLSVALHKFGPDLDRRELLGRVRAASEHESELVIDPRFFSALVGHIEDITGAEISLKRGRSSNELTRFRYDAVLCVGGAEADAACRRLDWRKDRLTLDRAISILAEQPDRLVLENVPNARVSADTRLLERLMRCSDQTRVRELQRQAKEESLGAMHPEDFWQSPGLRPWEIRICFSEPPNVDSFDVVLTRPGLPAVAAAAERQDSARAPSWSRYANNPLRGSINRRLAARIREDLSGKLPDYMIPFSFVLLDELPLLPNGKLNRAAIPSRSAVRQDQCVFVAPRTAVEQAVAAIWADVLDTEHIGIRDDFFTGLGGHSLLATRLLARIREAFCIDVPLKLLFQAPTVEQFAAALLDRAEEERDAIEAAAGLIARLGRMSEAELDAALCDGGPLNA